MIQIASRHVCFLHIQKTLVGAPAVGARTSLQKTGLYSFFVGMANYTKNHESNGHPNISWPLERPTRPVAAASAGQTEPTVPRLDARATTSTQYFKVIDLFSGEQRAFDGVAVRAFVLGIALGLASTIAMVLAYMNLQIWRLPFFIVVLSIFHFLEFYMTARYNTLSATIDAFLLSSNGKAYNIAHASAALECAVNSIFFPAWQASISSPAVLCTGLVAVIIGQVTRSAAMAHAGTNFNHTVQTRKVEGHQLVTTGVYSILRHPSYFGFFWWGLGTQMVLGNAICFLAYTYLLWNFFAKRIRSRQTYFTHCLSLGSLTLVQERSNFCSLFLGLITQRTERRLLLGYPSFDELR